VALGAALAPFLACLGKEEGLIFVPFAILLGHWYGRGRAAWLGSLTGLALAAGLRALALGSAIPAAHGAPLGDLPLFERVLTGGLAWVGGLSLVALPWKFPPGQGNLQADSLGPAGPWLAGLFLLSCLALAALAWRKRRHSPVLAGSLLLVLMSIIPTLEIIPAGEIFAPRYLYLPLLLAAPLTGALLAQVPRRILAVLLLLWIPLGWQASQPYTSRAAYWKARMEFGEETSMGWNALGNAHLEKQQSGPARRAFERAIELDPSYSRPWVNLGTLTWTELGPEAAHPILERACKEGPNNPAAHANLGALLLKLQQPIEAERHYTRAIELAPGRGAHWRGLGRALLAQGRRGEARTALETALQKLGQDPACETLLRRIQEG
jgi:tetratricopeptide (TPR) repeat protein